MNILNVQNEHSIFHIPIHSLIEKFISLCYCPQTNPTKIKNKNIILDSLRKNILTYIMDKYIVCFNGIHESLDFIFVKTKQNNEKYC